MALSEYAGTNRYLVVPSDLLYMKNGEDSINAAV